MTNNSKKTKQQQQGKKKRNDHGENDLSIDAIKILLSNNVQHETTQVMKCHWTGPKGESPPSQGLKKLRQEIGVVVKSLTSHCGDENSTLELCPPPIIEIEDENIPPIFIPIMKSLNISVLTTVQKQCWPAILSGANILAIAPTGSGKTLGFVMPMVVHINSHISSSTYKPRKKIEPMCLILEPTRELAIQVASVLKTLKRHCNIFSAAIYGGQNKEDQLDSMQAKKKDLHILVATPGRLIDYLYNDKAAISLSKVTYFVVDEADRMLALGFHEQIECISRQIRPDRQTLLFSATFPGKLRETIDTFISSRDAILIRCNSMVMEHGGVAVADDTNTSVPVSSNTITTSTVVRELKRTPEESLLQVGNDNDDSNDTGTAVVEENALEGDITSSSLSISRSVEQLIHVCATHKKPRLLLKYISTVREREKLEQTRQPGAMLVFCNKIKTLKFVKDFLTRQNVVSELLHGQLPQSRRESILNTFKAGKVNILLATDVAARGIHIKRLQYVVNYDFPSNIEQYCHRVGRTGRQGEKGFSYSLFTRNMAPLTKGLISLLSACGQQCEPNLLKLAEEFEAGDVLESELVAEEEGEGDEDEEEKDAEDTHSTKQGVKGNLHSNSKKGATNNHPKSNNSKANSNKKQRKV